jgi:DNA primase
MVSPDRQIYHCFGCNKGGNAFHFLMEYERMEFPEAVEFLAKKCGVNLPEKEKEDARTTNLITQLYKINELTASFYEGLLQTPAGTAAKNYLLKRGLRPETIKSSKLGFALDKWDALINHLRAKGISLTFLENAGLVLAKEGGGYYDRFRNRIIFTLLDIKSRVIGFGARVLDDTLPKYINSPETPIYTKGRNLYGLNLSKESIRDKDFAVVVEGYLDFIMPYQEGLTNIVASQGTALTYEQARTLKRYTHNAVIVYDGDNAGELATLRSLDIFIEEGMNARVVSLPEGLDPDSFVRKNGISKLKEKIAQAQDLFDYKLSVLKSHYSTQDIDAKAKIAEDMLSTINKFKNAVVKSEYIKRLAEELHLEEDALLQELKKVKDVKSYADSNQLPAKKTAVINPTEKLLIKLMLEETELINHIKERLEPADFQDEKISRIVSIMFDLVGEGKVIEPAKLMNYFDEEDITHVLSESTFLPEISCEEKDKVVDDCIQRLKNEKIKLKRQHLHDQIKTAQHLGDEKKLQELIQEFDHLVRKK